MKVCARRTAGKSRNTCVSGGFVEHRDWSRPMKRGLSRRLRATEVRRPTRRIRWPGQRMDAERPEPSGRCAGERSHQRSRALPL